MKLIIQIPCLNEELTLPETLKDLPKSLNGIDDIELLVIDDGSTDRTVEVAKEHGVRHVLSLTNNKGLAKAFIYGINHALHLGADIIVNTDADNQYFGGDIAKLIQPILIKRADIVIGDRQVETIRHFSTFKILLQKLGSWTVQQLSGTTIPDATSGFRAYSKEAALQMNVISDFTYTVETIISAGKKNIAIEHTPVRTNKKLRESRLFPSIQVYLRHSLVTMQVPLFLFSRTDGRPYPIADLICHSPYRWFSNNNDGHSRRTYFCKPATFRRYSGKNKKTGNPSKKLRFY